MATTDTTIKFTDVPTETGRDRVLAMASTAKRFVFASGEACPTDEQLIRAAMAVENIMRVGPAAPAPGTIMCPLAVALVAGQFMHFDDEPQPRADLLAERLCDPGAEVAAMVENRRLLEGAGDD